MKNKGKIIFIYICLFICILPFLGMFINPTNTTTENRKMATFPKIKEEGKLNINFLQELGIYFQDHFAFRPLLVSLDAEIQSKIFQVSNVESVITGSDGWLYYTSTTNDYLGKNTISGRGAENIANNLLLIQQYVQDRGAKFLFTVPPNKNSLYGENMPYYLQKKASNIKNIDILEEKIKKYNICYANLFKLFKEQKEKLYLKRDSHWNQKGAVLAYNAILNTLKIEHDSYSDVNCVQLKNEYGDLNKMLYPVTAKPEWNYFYDKENSFSYKTDTKSVEEDWIETENKNGTNSLLMFRDSFGNTLLPLMADTFKKGYFSKSVPQDIGKYTKMYNPDVVVLEKVERNIKELAKEPPLIEGAIVDLVQDIETAKQKNQNTLIEISESKHNTDYIEISGVLDNLFCTENVKIYVRVTDNNGQSSYKTLYVSNDKTDYGYKLDIPKEKFNYSNTTFEVIIENKGKLQVIKSTTLDRGKIKKLAGEKISKRKIISREKVYDCDGSGHGYYVITWSDGQIEYKDF